MKFRRFGDKPTIWATTIVFVLIVTAITLCAIFIPSMKELPQLIGRPNICPTSPPNPIFTPDLKGRFEWKNITVRYPVDSFSQLPTGSPASMKRVQYDFSQLTLNDRRKNRPRQQAVKKVFQRCWKSYRDFAWGQDELAPLSGGSKFTFGGWGATLVDSLDTLWIMGMTDEYAEAVEEAVKIDFGPRGRGEVSMFEVIIRYLGGFLGAYDISGCYDDRLLSKAVEVADMAYASYDTEYRTPINRFNPQKAADGEEQLTAYSGLIAEMASASVEFTRMSQLTGDMRYFDAISRITNMLDQQQGLTQAPGMWPLDIHVRTPNLRFGTQYTLGSMSDSAYEYLPKMYQLLSGRGEVGDQYLRMYEYAMSSAINYTLFRPMVEDKADILMAATYNSREDERDNQGQHLGCFAGGMFLLGGRLSSNDTHIDVGRKLSDGCAWVYRNTPTGIMPERFSMRACPTFEECDNTAKSDAGPFEEVIDNRYMLRPEAIESIFYMYRVTGDTMYQDIAWEMFQAIEKHTKTDLGSAAIRDVMKVPAEQENSMESFWLAETLKYFYLIFSEPELVSLDDFVLNTEAHPLRIPRE